MGHPCSWIFLPRGFCKNVGEVFTVVGRSKCMGLRCSDARNDSRSLAFAGPHGSNRPVETSRCAGLLRVSERQPTEYRTMSGILLPGKLRENALSVSVTAWCS